MTSENELIKRAQSGDSDAFCQLARRYERRIYSLALHYCRDPHDAEDLSQEVWLKAYRSVQSFRGGIEFLHLAAADYDKYFSQLQTHNIYV